MKKDNFNIIAGWSAIISAALFFISTIGMLQYLQGNLEEVPSFINNMIQHKAKMLLYGWPGLIATILMIPLFYAAHKRNTKSAEISKSVLVFSLVGVVFVAVGYLFHLAFTYFHAPLYSDLNETHQLAFNPVFQTNVGIQDMFWLSGDLFAFLGIAGLVMLNLTSRTTSRWLIVWVALSAVCAAIGSFSFIPAYKSNMVLGMMFMIGFALYALWQIAYGIDLIRKNKSL